MENTSHKKDIVIKCTVGDMVKRFFKDYMIVWHDPNLNTEENQLHIRQLERFCPIEAFKEWEEASIFLRKTKKICHVITSGANGEIFTREIKSHENVLNIYVFCKNKNYHFTWTKSYPKISCVEVEMQNIFNKIEHNLLEWYKRSSSFKLDLPAFAPIFNDTHKSRMNNLHRYLRVFPNFQNREQAKNDFTALSRCIYSEKRDLDYIRDFERNYNEYNKESILRWYSQESFLYRVTNNGLRIATSDSIQYCRLPLKDIQKAIQEQYQAKSKNFNGQLYRAGYLSNEEWAGLKQNKGREIEMHGFLSASKEKNVALVFLKMDPIQKIFITIIVPKGPNDEEQGFAEMDEFSEFTAEKEILFNVRSRFTILDVEERYSNEFPSRHLILLYGAQGFRKFIAEKRPVEEISIPEKMSCGQCEPSSHKAPQKMLFLPLGNLENSQISQLGFSERISRSIQTFYDFLSQFFSCKKPKPQKIGGFQNKDFYCKECLPSFIRWNTAPFLCVPFTNHPARKIKIKGALLIKEPTKISFYGYQCSKCQIKKQQRYFMCTHCEKNKNIWCERCFDNSSDCLKLGHIVLLESNPLSFWCEQMSQKELAHLKFQNDSILKDNKFQQPFMYSECHEYEKAIEYYKTWIDQNQENVIDIANCYRHLANVYSKQGEFKKALECHLKSLDIRKSVYGENHKDTASSYNNIGTIYRNQGEHQKALLSHLKSLEIRKYVYGEVHSATAASYINIGVIHLDCGDYEKALTYHLRSLKIRKALYGEMHRKLATCYSNMGVIYEGQREFNKALEYRLKSLQIKISVFGEEHPHVAEAYNGVGVVYSSQGEIEKALEYHVKSLEIRKSVYGEEHPTIAASYRNIGVIYHKHGEYQKAYAYQLKSLKINLAIYEENHPNIAGCYNNIGLIYESQREYKQALQCHLKSLQIKRTVYGVNHSHTANSLANIGRVYSYESKYSQALKYYLKSLHVRKSIYGKNHPKTIEMQENIDFIVSNNLSKQPNPDVQLID